MPPGCLRKIGVEDLSHPTRALRSDYKQMKGSSTSGGKMVRRPVEDKNAGALMPDYEIRKAARKGMIRPFVPSLVRNGVVSYGLSSFGYDVRLAPEFLVFTNTWPTVVDPKSVDSRAFVRHRGETCIVPPNSFVLGRTVEYFRMPENVIGIVLGKSTYARLGIIVNATPLEPEWEGHVTLEISNTTPLPARLYANEGIAQVIFLRSPLRPEVTYKDRAGIYQGQRGVTLPRVPAGRTTPRGARRM